MPLFLVYRGMYEMKQSKVRVLALNAVIAAMYAVLTIFLAPISYGSIQMRISEVLIFLAFYNKRYIPGLVLGCLIANLASPFGIWDIVFGTLATLLAVVLMNKVNNRYLGALCGAIVNGVIVGAELTVLLKNVPFYLNAFYVFVGELAILLIGAFVFGLVEKSKVIQLIKTA